jgi:hypothetical protein
MVKHVELFRTFLKNINPDDKAIGYAQEAHTRVRECLAEDDKFKQYVTGSFLYGSYKRQTAVGDIKDVDVVILTNFDIYEPEHTPAKVLRKLKAALARCYDDPDNPEYQRRSIRVDDPLPDESDAELTLDIIPAVVLNGDENALWVPDRDQAAWIQSHPKGHLQYVNDLNADDYSNGRFVPLAKIMKWWWKYQCAVRQPNAVRPKPKGFWVECLTAENFDPKKTSFAEQFITTLESVLSKYGSKPIYVPLLKDPGLPMQTIKTSMDTNEFGVFMTAVSECLDVAKQALEEEDPVTSSEIWREVFGDEFPLYDKEETEESHKAALAVRLDDFSHIEPLRWRIDQARRYKVRIDAHLYNDAKTLRLGGINSNGRLIQSGLRIRYKAWTNAPQPFEIYWQVVNTGAHARRANGLRGKLFADGVIRWESTLYTGKHWIQCFVVKDGVCVARSEPFYVNVRNPESP